MEQKDEMPPGWRLASVQDVTVHEKEVRDVLSPEKHKYGIFSLSDGHIQGSEYKFLVHKNNVYTNYGQKLAMITDSGRSNIVIINIEITLYELFKFIFYFYILILYNS